MGLVSATFYIIDTIRICSLQFGEGGGTRPQAQALGLHRADFAACRLGGLGTHNSRHCFHCATKNSLPILGEVARAPAQLL